MKRRELLKGSVLMPAFGMIADEDAGGAVDENPFPPKKITMKEPVRYSPLTYLEQVYDDNPPALAFRAADRDEAKAWRGELRAKLWELLGESHVPANAPPEAKLLTTETCDGYLREKWELTVVPGRSMPFYVLVPLPKPDRAKVVVCLHGHGGGARDVLNMPTDDEHAELITLLNTDYALQCVRKGWVAVAPELFAFGERLDYVEDARPGFDGGCEKPFLNAVQVGKTLIGIRAKDVCVLIDWLGFRDDLDTDDLACIGLSGGGMMTMYTAALDDRIKRAIISGYVTEMKGSIIQVRHCSCNYVPHLAHWADFSDIAGLIAPRPLIVQSGRKDAIFPIESVTRAYEKIQKVYDLHRAADRLRLHIHEGYHAFWSLSLDELFT